MSNLDIRTAAVGNGVYFYQIAEKLGITEFSFSRLMRKELSAEKKAQILNIINELSRVKSA